MSQLVEQAVMVAGKGFGNRVVAIKRRWSVGGSTVCIPCEGVDTFVL